MNLTPIKDSVIVQQDRADTIGSIVVPNQAQEHYRPLVGTVVAISPHEDELQPGDRVLFQPYSAGHVDALGKDFRILRKDDILATIGT